jgi:hypothetical protein
MMAGTGVARMRIRASPYSTSRLDCLSVVNDFFGEGKLELGKMRVESDQAGALPFESHGERAAHESQSDDPNGGMFQRKTILHNYHPTVTGFLMGATRRPITSAMALT